MSIGEDLSRNLHRFDCIDRERGAVISTPDSEETTIHGLARAIAVFLFVFAAPLAGAAPATLTVLHTSDLHGHVDPRDNPRSIEYGEGVARVATAVRAVRAEGRATLLLDSGDTIEGSPVEALVFSGAIPDRGDPIVRAMNLLGYDAMAIGNHEFNFGLERLQKSRREARFPWLSANTVGKDGKPAFAPYIVTVVAGVRVGILGLTTKNIPFWEPPAHVAGLEFLDTVETAKRYVPILRGKEKCDAVIVLTHQGFERDPATGKENGSSAENQAYAIATEVAGIDLLADRPHARGDRAPAARADLGLAAGTVRQHADPLRPGVREVRRPLESRLDRGKEPPDEGGAARSRGRRGRRARA